ncbi:hypothetical protein MAFF212519_28080 [Clavibacter michiganensis]
MHARADLAEDRSRADRDDQVGVVLVAELGRGEGLREAREQRRDHVAHERDPRGRRGVAHGTEPGAVAAVAPRLVEDVRELVGDGSRGAGRRPDHDVAQHELVDQVRHGGGVRGEGPVEVRTGEGTGEEARHRGDGVARGQLQGDQLATAEEVEGVLRLPDGVAGTHRVRGRRIHARAISEAAGGRCRSTSTSCCSTG